MDRCIIIKMDPSESFRVCRHRPISPGCLQRMRPWCGTFLTSAHHRALQNFHDSGTRYRRLKGLKMPSCALQAIHLWLYHMKSLPVPPTVAHHWLPNFHRGFHLFPGWDLTLWKTASSPNGRLLRGKKVPGWVRLCPIFRTGCSSGDTYRSNSRSVRFS